MSRDVALTQIDITLKSRLHECHNTVILKQTSSSLSLSFSLFLSLSLSLSLILSLSFSLSLFLSLSLSFSVSLSFSLSFYLFISYPHTHIEPCSHSGVDTSHHLFSSSQFFLVKSFKNAR